MIQKNFIPFPSFLPISHPHLPIKTITYMVFFLLTAREPKIIKAFHSYVVHTNLLIYFETNMYVR